MAGVAARAKTHKRVKEKDTCSKTICHFTRSAAKIQLEELKKKSLRGDSRLVIYRCDPHSASKGRVVYHVGHRR